MRLRLGMIMISVIAVAVSCGGGSTNKSDNGSAGKTVQITYQVRGFANFPLVTYRTATGSVSKNVGDNSIQHDVHDDEVVDMKIGEPVSMTVESKFLGDQSVTCVIVGSDGKEIAKNTATGQMGKASCDGVAS